MKAELAAGCGDELLHALGVVDGEVVEDEVDGVGRCVLVEEPLQQGDEELAVLLL